MEKPVDQPLTARDAGLIGSRRRWGAPRIARLDPLPDEDRQRIHDNIIELIRARQVRAQATRQ
jgi:hypothetical protein